MLNRLNFRRIVLALAVLFLLSSGAAYSDEFFYGPYAVGNWTTTLSNSDGWVDTSLAPSSVTLWGGDNQSGLGGTTLFSIIVPSATTQAFAWDYQTFDCCGGVWDPAGYEINGVFTQLSLNLDPYVGSSGTTTVSLNAGDEFGFYVNTPDNILARAEITISPVPEPATLTLLGSALIGLAGMMTRRRRQRG
jgi:hypothetical protein